MHYVWCKAWKWTLVWTVRAPGGPLVLASGVGKGSVNTQKGGEILKVFSFLHFLMSQSTVTCRCLKALREKKLHLWLFCFLFLFFHCLDQEAVHGKCISEWDKKRPRFLAVGIKKEKNWKVSGRSGRVKSLAKLLHNIVYEILGSPTCCSGSRP